MTKEQVIQHAKSTALNSIRAIYDERSYRIKYNFRSSFAEQRDEVIMEIIRKLEDDLFKIKHSDKYDR
jgi:hypothetical protein